MLTKEQNDLLTHTGPGTPMGKLMRRYWIPVLLSWELPEPDCAPMRVKVLGEQLVAFRDTSGRVGVLDELCAHRCASLFLGRNEEGGLRCVFHGWKYDVEGNCLDMPNEPAETDFKDRVHQIAYPAVEMGGIIWTYMGPPELKPALPKFEFTQVPDTQRQVTKTWEECNWLQGLEGGIDSIHSSFLHRALGAPSARGGLGGFRQQSVSAKLDVDLTEYGHRYVSMRPLGERGDYARLYHYVMPWTQIRASQGADGFRDWKPQVSGHFWVPMDDENHMVWNWTYRWDDQPLPESEWTARQPNYQGGEQIPGGFRKVRNKDNNWLIDRQVQKRETFSGIDGVNTQDHAVQESMGSIVDRSREHLGTTDKAVVTARLLLLKALATVEAGDDPPGVSDAYHGIRAIEHILSPGTRWRDALLSEAYPNGSAVHAGA